MNAKVIAAEVFLPATCQLGESAIWQAETEDFVFVDIDAGKVHRLDVRHPVASVPVHLGDWVSAAVPASDGRLLVTASRGVGLLDTGSGALEILHEPDEHLTGHRYNDAKCDRDGRLLVGTMWRTSPRTATGRLYRIDGDGRALLIDGLRTPNALCFSPDGRIMYFCDTGEGVIWRFPYDRATGTLGPREVLAEADIAPGRPDGATVDAEGCLWNARYNGGVVVRITPDGRVDQTIELPVTQITSCAFVGSGLDTLLITTARQNLDAGALSRQPLAGSIFVARPEVGGILETPFAVTAQTEIE